MIKTPAQPTALLSVVVFVAMVSAQNSQQQSSSPGSAIQAAAQAAAHDQATGRVHYLKRLGPIGIVSDTQGVDFHTYVRDVHTKIRTNWIALVPVEARLSEGSVEIEFAIQKDGRVTDMKLVSSAEDTDLDRAAWAGITSSAPFPKFPSEFTGPLLRLRIRFICNPNWSDLHYYRHKAEFVETDAPELAETPQSESSWARTSARVDIEIVGAPPGSDFNSYIETSVLPIIRATWYRLASKSGEKAGGDATLQFTILKDGGVSDVKVTDGAGHAALGDLAMDAVRRSGPFAPLPAQFSGQFVSVRGHFFYEPEARPLNAEPTRQSGSAHEVTINGVAEPVYHVGNGVTAPRTTYNPPPEFSEEARKKKIDGVVTLSMVVTSEGNTDQIKVVKGIGHGLDEKAMEAVSKWKFQPATKDGKPVSVEMAVEVDFHLMKGPR